jgi:hypothetical protein
MNYRITITAVEPNPNYQTEMKEHESRARYSGLLHIPEPLAEREVKKLETILTEDEFKAARDAILGAM